jgi:hypothetical protein
MKISYLASVALVMAGLAAVPSTAFADEVDEDASIVCWVGAGGDDGADVVCDFAEDMITTCGELAETGVGSPCDGSGIVEFKRPDREPRITTQTPQAKPKRKPAFRPKVKVGLIPFDSALPTPKKRKRVSAGKRPKLGIARPSAAMTTFGATSVRRKAPGRQRIR